MLRAWCAFAVLAVGVGCGPSQPRIYRVAIDLSPMTDAALPASCFIDQAKPADVVSAQNLRLEKEWVVWDGASPKAYLDQNGGTPWKLGDATPIDIVEMIEGSDKSFTGSKTRTTTSAAPAYALTEQASVNITFEQWSQVSNGTLVLSSQYSCLANPQTNCPANRVSCGPITLPFVARRVDTTKTSVYTE